jgi:hypothetical protein
VNYICFALALSTGTAVSGAGSDVRGFADFQRRVEQYVKLHKEMEKKVPPIKDRANPEQIILHEKALAAAIGKARAGVRPGSIITPVAKKEIAKLIAAEMKGPRNKPTRDAAKTGNPEFPTSTDPEVKDIKLVVNAAYPKDASVSTMPPSVLLKLPKLPEELEYRFVGRDLVLLDRVANIIVDYATGVAPL